MRHYSRIAAWFTARPRALRLLTRLNHVLPLVFYYLYPLLLLQLAVRQERARFLRVLLVPAAAFAACTALRRVFRAKRPYESPGFVPLIPREKTGDSFPSRHMASAAVIAFAYWYVYPAVGAVLAAAAACIAVTRVLAGIHFPRDVIAGGALGFAAGIIGFRLL